MDILNDMITSDQPNSSEAQNIPLDQNFQFTSDPMDNQGPSDMNDFKQPFPSNDMNTMNDMMNAGPSNEPFDEEEAQRIQDRQREENERRQKIEEKINLELKQKNELREQAKAYFDEWEAKRQSNIAKRKEQNLINEKEFLNNKQLVKEGKKNPWEIVTDNIALKESDYKGSNDVTRMRSVIIARKNDQTQNSNNLGGFI